MFVTCLVVMGSMGAILFMFFRKLAAIEEERWGDKAAWGKTPWWMKFFGGSKTKRKPKEEQKKAP